MYKLANDPSELFFLEKWKVWPLHSVYLGHPREHLSLLLSLGKKNLLMEHKRSVQILASGELSKEITESFQRVFSFLFEVLEPDRVVWILVLPMPVVGTWQVTYVFLASVPSPLMWMKIIVIPLKTICKTKPTVSIHSFITQKLKQCFLGLKLYLRLWDITISKQTKISVHISLTSSCSINIHYDYGWSCHAKYKYTRNWFGEVFFL